MTNQIENLMALADDLTITSKHMRLKALAEFRQALEAALNPQYDQQALELCDACGWKAVIPGYGCLNCQREAALEPGEPVYQRQSVMTGHWVDLSQEDYENFSNDSGHETRILYTAAPPAQTPPFNVQVKAHSRPGVEPNTIASVTPPRLTGDELWKFWWDRPEVPDGEDDSMEAKFVAAGRAIETAVRKQFGVNDE